MEEDDYYDRIAAASDETCRYCQTTGDAGSSCESPCRALECPHMDACDLEDLRRELFEEDRAYDCD